MSEIIPSINVKTFSELKERIEKVEPYVSWCHIDVTDGLFSKHITWNNPEDLKGFKSSVLLELHLMIEDTDRLIDKWLVDSIQRLIVHYESVSDMDLVIEKCRQKNKQIGISVKPETDWRVLALFFGRVDILQMLAVSPGPSGQEIKSSIYKKIAEVKKSCPECTIEVDGGVNKKTITRLKKCGADLFVAGSAIFSTDYTAGAIQELKARLS